MRPVEHRPARPAGADNRAAHQGAGFRCGGPGEIPLRLNCYFRPLFAFIRDKGRSPKFICWQLDGTRALLDRSGQKIAVDDVKVVVRKNQGGESRSSLFARSDVPNAQEIKADQVKVKYLIPPYPNHDRRYNEVFTEVAATRYLWALGFHSSRI